MKIVLLDFQQRNEEDAGAVRERDESVKKAKEAAISIAMNHPVAGVLAILHVANAVAHCHLLIYDTAK